MTAPGALVADRYRLVRQLGVGGMGVVWEARDERLDRQVAIKQLRSQPGLTEAESAVVAQRAMREARINASLQHPYAVSVFDVVADGDGNPCLVMELVPSVPLSQLLRELGALEPAETARVGAQVASALAAAHQLGIVHRDVKPGNILIGDDGAARICDFGISRALGDATLTMTGMITGTPAYLAPEVARGEESTYASDVFSLGATLYAAVEGEPPFGTEGNAIAVLYRVTSGELRPPQQAGTLEPLLLSMMSPDPQHRPSMAEVTAALSTTQAPTPTPTPPPTPPSPDPTPTPVLPTAAPTLLRPAVPPTPAEAPTPAGPPASATPPTPATDQRPQRRPALAASFVALVVALLVVAGVVAFVLLRHEPDGSTSGSSPTASTTTAAPSVTGAPTTAQLAQAVTDYYALLPDDTDAAWQLLTPSYQRQSGGQDAYERFWNDFDTVTASDVRATAPDRVDATISYVRKSGNQRSTERRTFRLIVSDGVLKINQSSLL